jgi:hypothetical protein
MSPGLPSVDCLPALPERPFHPKWGRSKYVRWIWNKNVTPNAAGDVPGQRLRDP